MERFVAELSKIIDDESMIDYIKDVAESSDTLEDFIDVAKPILMDLIEDSDDSSLDKVCRDLFKYKSTTEEETVQTIEKPVVLSKLLAETKTTSQEQLLFGNIRQFNDPLERGENPIFNEDISNSKSIRRAQQKEKKKIESYQQERLDAIAEETSQFRKGTHFRRPKNHKPHEIILKEINVSIGPLSLLSDAELSLAPGNRYGLVGRNGMGKTTFMKYMNSGVLRGMSDDMLIIHVEQEAPISERTVLDAVLDCDIERTELLARRDELEQKENATASDTEELQEIAERLIQINASNAVAKASMILVSLGFSHEMLSQPLSACSGGFRMRVSLAQALYIGPDVLMLDEPTGHLDAPSVCWLEEYLTTQCGDQILLVISHDRVFLDNVCTHIVHLKDQKLTTYHGNFSAFQQQFEAMIAEQERAHANQMAYIEHKEDFVRRLRYKAWAAAQAQTRLRQIKKAEEELVNVTERDPPVFFRFELTTEAASEQIVTMEDISFAYPTRPIFSHVDFALKKDSRVIIIGGNGTGKSTFVKLMMQELKPTDGFFQVIQNLRIGYFCQHHIDQMDYDSTPLQFMLERHRSDNSVDALRRILGEFGIGSDMIARPIKSLSGGQKTRVALASIAIIHPHLIILDEVTNNLDMDSIEALGEALGKYRGAIVAITHDQHFAELIGGDIYVCENMGMRPFKGTFAEFRKQIKSQIKQDFLKTYQAGL